MSDPLAGIRILDLTRLLPGPYATRWLADLGAEVIKIEDPNGGDYARWYPPLTGEPPTGSLFRALNRGKKSVTLDLRQTEGQTAFRTLLGQSDVLVDSFRPGVLKRLGLDPAQLMADHPRLIYCAITGFGLTGPDAHRAGHDIGYLARAGALAMGAEPDRPGLSAVQVADVGGAQSAVSGILAALFQRERTGRGQVVDVSLTEAALAFGIMYFSKRASGEKPRRGEETLDGSRPCYGIYETKDGRHLAVGALEPKFWTQFLEAIDLPELRSDALDGGASGAAAKEKIQARLAERTLAEWTTIFRSIDACVEPVLDLDDVATDPHLAARQAIVDFQLAPPMRLKTRPEDPLEPPQTRHDAPSLGKDTEAVLRDAGVPDEVLRLLI